MEERLGGSGQNTIWSSERPAKILCSELSDWLDDSSES